MNDHPNNNNWLVLVAEGCVQWLYFSRHIQAGHVDIEFNDIKILLLSGIMDLQMINTSSTRGKKNIIVIESENIQYRFSE